MIHETVMLLGFFPQDNRVLPIQETLHTVGEGSCLFSQPPVFSFLLVVFFFFFFFFCPSCSLIPGSGFQLFKLWCIITDE